MIFLKAILLGIVQGLTEFIPVSSSAHLVILPWAFDWDDQVLESLPFDVALHLGTLVAVLAFFGKDFIRLGKAWFESIADWNVNATTDRRLSWFIIVGCIPAGVVGLLAESKVEHLFHPAEGDIRPGAMLVLGGILAFMGVVLWLCDRHAKHERGMGKITFRDVACIGVAQAMAVFPGVSRSGATISAGLFLGLEREAAARFSFLLSAPIIAGAGGKGVISLAKAYAQGTLPLDGLAACGVGFVAAAISGFLCIKLLLRFLQSHTVLAFAVYRIILAVAVAGLAISRWGTI